MRLHENSDLFDQAIRAAAQEKGLLEIYIEKDYWVTLALRKIFQSDTAEYSVFKGGTALSKCHGLIERFSEDIDIVVMQKEGETANQKKAKIKKIGGLVAEELPEEYLEGVTNKTGMIRKTVHAYPVAFDGAFGQIRDKIILEATWFGHSKPYNIHDLSTFVYEMMVKTGQEEMAEEYNMMPFPVKVMQPKRTFCEKIMSLVRFSYGDNPLADLRLKIRHTYDLHQMRREIEILEFLSSADFEAMLKSVAEEDVISFKNNNDWLRYHPNQALIFADLDLMKAELKGTYEGVFAGLVYGELPAWEEIVVTLGELRDRMEGFDWDIYPEN